MPFSAVDIREGETPHDVVKLIFEAAKAQKVRFTQLDLLGYLILGSRRFVRFRYDKDGLVAVLKTLGREAVVPEGEGYVLAGTKTPIPALSLQSVAERSLRRTYRGTGVKFWERQFLV